MRVTGGEWASRRLPALPKGDAIRPTPDALREQAFAILGPELEGAAFLDLFAGTGVNSLEALSRGAARAVLVERNPAAARLIRTNLAAFGVARDRARVVLAEAGRAVSRLAGDHAVFDLAWCDPPFAAFDVGERVLLAARERGLIAPGALVVLEHPPKAVVRLPGFDVLRELRGALLLRVAT